MTKILFFSPSQNMLTAARNDKNALLPIHVLLSERFLLTKTTLKGFLSHTLTGGRAECLSEHSYLCSYPVFAYMDSPLCLAV